MALMLLKADGLPPLGLSLLQQRTQHTPGVVS